MTAPVLAAAPNAIATTADFEFGALDEARNYRDAVLAEFAPFLKGRVIEVGAGIGQFTQMIARVPSVERIVAVEPDPGFAAIHRREHPTHEVVEGTIDAVNAGDGWDAIVSVNVLEHIERDRAELATYADHLGQRRGYLCLFVPAMPRLYAPIDKDFGHFRRYEKEPLRFLLEASGFDVVRIEYFNWLGAFAWWFQFRLLKKRKFDRGKVRFFDRHLFPIGRRLELDFGRPPFGQSLFAVARALKP